MNVRRAWTSIPLCMVLGALERSMNQRELKGSGICQHQIYHAGIRIVMS